MTYAAALRYEKEAGGRPMLSASYRWSDGAYSYTELSVPERSYYFTETNPEDDTEVIAVEIRLHPIRADA